MSSINPKLVPPISLYSSSLHLETARLPICSWISSSFNTERTLTLETASPPQLPFSFKTDQSNNLIKKEFKEEWETVWVVFLELLENPRKPATISLTSPHYPHKHLLQHSLQHPPHNPHHLSHIHPQSISYTNITTSNSIPKYLTHTSTSIFERVTIK